MTDDTMLKTVAFLPDDFALKGADTTKLDMNFASHRFWREAFMRFRENKGAMFSLITTGQMGLAIIGAIVMAISFSGHAAVVHTVLLEMFPTSVRYSAYSIGFSLSTIIFGGSAPLIMTEIIKATKDSMVPAYASIITALITLVTIFFLAETRGKPLALD